MRNQKTRGQAVVEFALILPLLLLLVLGIIEFGRIYMSYIEITSAAREGARAAAVEDRETVDETPPMNGDELARDAAARHLEPSFTVDTVYYTDVDPSSLPDPGVGEAYVVIDRGTPGKVKVTVKGTVSTITQYIKVLDTDICLSKQATMRTEY